ncbi:major facilitator superfamily domain-containing protein [Phyllosticta citrichinensis]|uniref:Major facilitator superfamily domain-containing protein n=1 Tax=Phyllosticta citrichinensis TaxID=1130410 RepID=A0ABR1XQ88_9PEZI
MTVRNGPSSETSPLLPPRSPSSHSSKSSTSSARHVADGSEQTISVYRGAAIVASLGMIIFLQACNFSLLTTTQSSIAAEFDAFEEATWFTSAYLIPMSSITPLMGRLSQVFSPRICIFVSALIFALGSLIAAFSRSLEWFLVGRVVAGSAGAGVTSVAIIIVLQVGGAKHRGLLLGVTNSIITTGVSLGAVLGGVIEPRLGWRAVFWPQTPLLILAGIAVFLSIPSHLGASKNDTRSLRQRLMQIDYLGAVLLTLTIFVLLLGLSGRSIKVIPVLVSLLVFLPLFTFIELRVSPDPIIPVSLLSSRGLLLSCLATVTFMASRWSVLFYTPVYAIGVRLWAPAAAGSILIPTNVGFAIGGLAVGALHIRRAGSFYFPSLFFTALFPISLLSMALSGTAAFAAAGYVVLTFINGAVTGAVVNYTLVHALHLTPPATHFIVTSLLATFRGFAGSFGAAAGGGIFARFLSRFLYEGFQNHGIDPKEERIRELIRRLVGSPALVGKLQGVEREVAVASYEGALRGLFLVAVAVGVGVVFAQAGTGWKGWEERPGEHGRDSEEQRRDEVEEAERAEVGAA